MVAVIGDLSSNPSQKRPANALTSSAGVVVSFTESLPLMVPVTLPRTLSASEQRQLLTHRLGRGVQTEVWLTIGPRRLGSSGEGEQVIPLQDMPVAIGKRLTKQR